MCHLNIIFFQKIKIKYTKYLVTIFTHNVFNKIKDLILFNKCINYYIHKCIEMCTYMPIYN